MICASGVAYIKPFGNKLVDRKKVNDEYMSKNPKLDAYSNYANTLPVENFCNGFLDGTVIENQHSSGPFGMVKKTEVGLDKKSINVLLEFYPFSQSFVDSSKNANLQWIKRSAINPETGKKFSWNVRTFSDDILNNLESFFSSKPSEEFTNTVIKMNDCDLSLSYYKNGRSDDSYWFPEVSTATKGVIPQCKINHIQASVDTAESHLIHLDLNLRSTGNFRQTNKKSDKVNRSRFDNGLKMHNQTDEVTTEDKMLNSDQTDFFDREVIDKGGTSDGKLESIENFKKQQAKLKEVESVKMLQSKLDERDKKLDELITFIKDDRAARAKEESERKQRKEEKHNRMALERKKREDFEWESNNKDRIEVLVKKYGQSKTDAIENLKNPVFSQYFDKSEGGKQELISAVKTIEDRQNKRPYVKRVNLMDEIDSVMRESKLDDVDHRKVDENLSVQPHGQKKSTEVSQNPGKTTRKRKHNNDEVGEETYTKVRVTNPEHLQNLVSVQAARGEHAVKTHKENCLDFISSIGWSR